MRPRHPRPLPAPRQEYELQPGLDLEGRLASLGSLGDLADLLGDQGDQGDQVDQQGDLPSPFNDAGSVDGHYLPSSGGDVAGGWCCRLLCSGGAVGSRG